MTWHRMERIVEDERGTVSNLTWHRIERSIQGERGTVAPRSRPNRGRPRGVAPTSTSRHQPNRTNRQIALICESHATSPNRVRLAGQREITNVGAGPRACPVRWRVRASAGPTTADTRWDSDCVAPNGKAIGKESRHRTETYPTIRSAVNRIARFMLS